MQLKKSLLALSAGLFIVLLIMQCGPDKTDKVISFKDTIITPVPLPSIVPGFSFPEDSTKIYGWLAPYDSTSVYNHAWGIWAGLTANSGQTFQGDSLLVYETWLGIAQIQNAIINKNNKTIAPPSKSSRVELSVPKQFQHASNFIKMNKVGGTIDTSAGSDFGSNFWVAVSYNPSAANYVISNSLLNQSVLDSYKKKDAIGSIPPFPSDAITLKPTYFVGHVSDSLIRISAWPGPPSPVKAYDQSIWNNYVYVDVNNKQAPGKKIVPVSGNEKNPAALAAATCNLNDFIYFKIDQAMASRLNRMDKAVQGDTAKAGDVALLVAMHVTTKEINNWTWQTFYWAPDPSTPLSPSSTLAASLRPAQLQGAASHYGLSTAYTMVLPNQPITGGTNKGTTSMIGYNPYLEATFGPSTFGFPNINPTMVTGVQTNCMSCHIMANAQNPNLYSTDQYIDLKNPVFKNKVQIDFAWSIQQAIIQDSATANK